MLPSPTVYNAPTAKIIFLFPRCIVIDCAIFTLYCDTLLFQETAPKSSFFSMLRMNKQEWPLILVGCINAAINGCTMPVFSIFFSEMINVSDYLSSVIEGFNSCT